MVLHANLPDQNFGVHGFSFMVCPISFSIIYLLCMASDVALCYLPAVLLTQPMAFHS